VQIFKFDNVEWS